MIAAPIDLKPFCSSDPERRALHHPWSRGEYTYATSGLILVRVPRRADVGEYSEAPDPSKLIERVGSPDYFSPPAVALPKREERECFSCDGSGFAHKCPECSCPCWACDGNGLISDDRDSCVTISGAPFALALWRLIAELPGLEISKIKDTKDGPLPFRFEGGIGLLMGLRSPLLNVIEIIP